MTGETPRPPAHSPPVTSVWSLAELYVQKFGMLTFGTVTLILLHMLIFDPMLERNQISIDAQRSLVEEQKQLHESQRELHRQQEDLAQHLNGTAKVFDSFLSQVLQMLDKKRQPE